MLASRRLLFRSSFNDWARVPYINNPKHEKFFSNLDSAATFSASTVSELNASDLVDIVKREIGACINIGDSPEQAARVAQIILDNRAAFKSPDRPVGKFKSYVAAIETLPGKTRHVPQYKIPQRHYGPLTEEIKKLKSLGILIPSDNTCGWNTPVGGVLKSDGSTRLILSLNLTVNKVLQNADTFMIPFLDEESTIPPGNIFFGTLDIGYFQWFLEHMCEDQVKLTITWQNETLKFCRMPFGLKTSGHVFSRAIAFALKGMKYRENVKVYVDDLLVFASDFDTYCNTLIELLGRIHEFGFIAGGKKTFLLYDEVKWLGRLVNSKGQRVDPDNATAILKMEPPTDFKGLQSLIGLCNWIRNFCAVKPMENVALESFSEIMRPITSLLKTNRPKGKFAWSSEATTAFNKMKQKLASPSTLWFPDFELPFCLITDASAVAAGWALVQVVDHKSRIIRIGSKTLNDAQRRYSATEREALGVILAVEDCRVYLQGRPFTIKSDHRSLVFIDAKISKNDKLARWWAFLSQFDFVVVYLEGHCNTLADYFSRPANESTVRPTYNGEIVPAGQYHDFHGFRIYCPSWVSLNNRPNIEFDGNDLVMSRGNDLVAHVSHKVPIDQELCQKTSITSEQYHTESVRNAIDALRHAKPYRSDGRCEESGFLLREFKHLSLCPETGALMHKKKLYIPASLRSEILTTFHTDRNHAGGKRMLELLSHMTWPNLSIDVENFVRSCFCHHAKGLRGRHQDPGFRPTIKASRPFERIHVDFIELPTSRSGLRYAVTMVCTFSKFLIVAPTRRCRAVDAVKAISEKVLDNFPYPSTISTDRGTHFTSQLNAEFAAANSIKWRFHCAFRPQSCSLLESRHRELKNCIFIAVHSLSVDWPAVVKRVVFIMNSMPNKSTGVSPFQAVFGVPPRISEFDKITEMPTGVDIPDFLRNRRRVTDLLYRKMSICQQSADDAVLKNRPRIEPEPLEPGDMILLKREHSTLAKTSKLRYLGPYYVQNSNGHVVQAADEHGNSDWYHRSSCIKKVQRFQHLGPIPFFPNLAIPLPKTTPAPPKVQIPLVDPIPDSIRIDSEAGIPESTPLPPADAEETQFYDCEDPENSISPTPGSNSEQNSVPEAENRTTVPLQLPVQLSSDLPLSSAPTGTATAPGSVRIRRPNPRQPAPYASRPNTRGHLLRVAQDNERDRKLAVSLQNQDLRRSGRNNL